MRCMYYYRFLIYGRTSILQALARASDLVELFTNATLSMAFGSANSLVSGVTRKQDHGFDYSYYNPGLYDVTHWLGSEGKNSCEVVQHSRIVCQIFCLSIPVLQPDLKYQTKTPADNA